ncbi:unnamed protein product, partial [Trichogramma brassicae]
MSENHCDAALIFVDFRCEEVCLQLCVPGSSTMSVSEAHVKTNAAVNDCGVQ